MTQETCTPSTRRTAPRSLTLGAAFLFLGLSASLRAQPMRGDVDGDRIVDLSDPINIFDHLFLGGFPLYCQAVADANADELVDIADPVRILGFLFLGEPPLAALSAVEAHSCPWNAPPEVLPRRAHRLYPGFAAEFPIPVTDPEGEELRFEPVSLPDGAVLDEDGTLRWIPREDQIGMVHARFAVRDGDTPPNRVEGEVVFLVLPLDACTRPRCDPVLGCAPELLEISQDCCGEPPTRLPEPDAPCPEGRVLHVGRNPLFPRTIGRLYNCDLLRLVPLGQGGHVGRINVETRCLDPQVVTFRARLETATVVLFDDPIFGALEARPDGYHESRGLGFVAEGRFDDGQEALLTVTAREGNVVVEEKLRIVITRDPVPDLP